MNDGDPSPPPLHPTTPLQKNYGNSHTRGGRPNLRDISPFRERCLSVSNSNALDNISVVEDLLMERPLILLLDYDGTLTPIVNDPSKALLGEEVREILRELPKHYVTGVVSGRSLAKIMNFVKVPGLYYAGSHGFDILAPTCDNSAAGSAAHVIDCDADDGKSSPVRSTGLMQPGCVRYQVAGEFLPLLQDIRRLLEEGIKDIPAAEVEDNIYSISLHYRNCSRSDVPRVQELATRIQTRHEGIRLRSGKEVFELQPDIKWNKGSAVVWLLEMLGIFKPSKKDAAENGPLNGEDQIQYVDDVINDDDDDDDSDSETERQKVFTVFIGDDKTDEDAFKVFTGEHEKGRQPGLGILVSEESRKTHAAFTLRDPHEVAIFLSKLVDFGRALDLKPVHVCTNEVEETVETEMGRGSIELSLHERVKLT